MSNEITIDPTIVLPIVREHFADVASIKDFRDRVLIDPIAMIQASSPAYSVELFPLHTFVTVIRNKRFGFDENMTYVPYPAEIDDPEFAAKLVATLAPVVDQERWLAAERKHLDHKENGPGATYEARDAITRIS